MRKLLLTFCVLCLLAFHADAQCGAALYDGFESGSYSPTWTIGAGLTSGAVTTTNPYSGLYRLEGTGGTSSHLTGFNTTFAASTPSFMSWDVYPTGTGASNYMVAGDASLTANNCIMFCYWQGGTNIRFVSSSTYIYTCPPNAWYHIEMRNVNFTAHTFDIWINGVLVSTAFPFRSSTVNNVSRVSLYNFNSSVGVWDNITIGTGTGPATSTVVTNPSCNGGNNGAIDLSATGGNPGYSYLWSNGATTQDVTALTAGTYVVTVTDQTPCSTATSIVVTEPTLLTSILLPTDASCNGFADGGVTNNIAGGIAGYTCIWSTGSTAQNITGLTAGSYSVTVSDANNCTTVSSTSVLEPTAISIADSVLLPSCTGDSNGAILLTPAGGTGNYTYLWSTGDVVATISLLPAGTYGVTVTDGTGCSHVDSVLVADPAPLIPSIQSYAPACAGDSSGSIDLTPTGGTPVYTYAWSNGSSLEDLTGIASGTYAVIVTDQNGCVASDSVTLNEPAAIVASGTSTDDTGSNNGSIDLTASGGTGSLSYLWSNGATTQDINGLAAGTYTVTITDDNSCIDVQTFTIDLVIAVGEAFPVGVSVAPNPFSTSFIIRLSGMGNVSAQLALTDLQGRLLWEQNDVTEGQVLVDPVLTAGVYFLEVRMAGQRKTLKLVRQ